MAWFSGDPDPAYENAQEKAFEDLERKRTAAKKAEFPCESFKVAMEITPIYTQSEMDVAIAARDKEWVEWMEDNLKVDQVTPNITYLYLRITDKQWQSRRKEIGL